LFLFKGDIAANLLQDESAEDKQVFDLKHQQAKTAVCRVKSSQIQFLADFGNQDYDRQLFVFTFCF